MAHNKVGIALNPRTRVGRWGLARENPVNQSGSVARSVENMQGCGNAFIDKNSAFDPKKSFEPNGACATF
jgi:hypothetical protein